MDKDELSIMVLEPSQGRRLPLAFQAIFVKETGDPALIYSKHRHVAKFGSYEYSFAQSEKPVSKLF